MSEQAISIVDMDIGLDDAPAKVVEMIAWLQAEGIIGEGVAVGELYRESLGSRAKDPMVADLVNDPRIVYRPGLDVGKAMTANRADLFKNWLEIDIERKVYTAGESGLGIFCAVCNSDQTDRNKVWGNAISDWYEGGEGVFACEACGSKGSLRQWIFDPVWAFGNLGFTFCDWELKPEFIAVFQKKLGNASRVIYAHF